jgi:hypothetical protein
MTSRRHLPPMLRARHHRAGPVALAHDGVDRALTGAHAAHWCRVNDPDVPVARRLLATQAHRRP